MNKAKEYLNQIRNLDSQIRRRQQEVMELKESVTSMSGIQLDADHIRTDSPDPDPLASKVGKYVDMQNEINDMIDELILLKHTIVGQIQKLGEAKYMDVLWKRYVDLKTFEQIADEMSYSVRHITSIHGRALQAFEEMYRL